MARNLVVSFLSLFFMSRIYSQTIISGMVTSHKKEPLSGACISHENSYNGTTSAKNGSFSFISTDTGLQKIIITLMGYKTFTTEVLFTSTPITINVVLKEEVSELEAVTVSAGIFEASDKKRNTVLKPLDILTTAGHQADIVVALKTLPGAQQIGETEGLFIIAFNKPNIEANNLQDYFRLTNKHVFSILTYTGNLNTDWKLTAGTGFSYNKDNINIADCWWL